jgi:hypothetical protein
MVPTISQNLRNFNESISFSYDRSRKFSFIGVQHSFREAALVKDLGDDISGAYEFDPLSICDD